VIAEIALENPRYAEDRAIELVREAQSAGPGSGFYHDTINRAIGMLALARAVRD
jgi:hypothetical protein